MSRARRTFGLGCLLVGLGWPLGTEGQACEQVEPGDRVHVDVDGHFLDRLWVRKDFLTALFTRTVPREGYFLTVTEDSLWLSHDTRALDAGAFKPGRDFGFPLAEVRTIRKNCRGDPVWDGALFGAVGGASLAFTIDLLAMAAVPFGLRPFPIAREHPEMYLIPAAVAMVALGLLDWAAPDWIEVAMPQPAGARTFSLGLAIPVR